jgi:hypothetical protein
MMDKTAVKGVAKSLMRSKKRDNLADVFGDAFDDVICISKSTEINGCQIIYDGLEDGKD